MNLFTLFISTIFGVLEVFGVLMITLTLYRIPYRSYFIEMIIISTVVSAAATMTYDVWEIHYILSEVTGIALTYILYRLLFKTSRWHSLVLNLTGYIIYGFVMSLPIVFGIAEAEKMAHSLYTTISVQFYLFVVLGACSLYLDKKGWGFLFISRKMPIKPELRRLSRLMAGTGSLALLCALAFYHLSMESYPLKNYMLIVFLLSLILMMWTSYLLSSKEIEEKFSRFNLHKVLALANSKKNNSA
jgi:hypothetical protein